MIRLYGIIIIFYYFLGPSFSPANQSNKNREYLKSIHIHVNMNKFYFIIEFNFFSRKPPKKSSDIKRKSLQYYQTEIFP